MSGMFKKKWAWVVVLFLIINIAGLLKIISLLEHEGSISALIDKRLWQITRPAKKAATSLTEKLQRKKEFTFDQLFPAMDVENPHLYAIFSRRVSPEDIKGYISITPKIDFYTERHYNGIRIYGDFSPGASYTVEALKGMPSADGAILKETVRQAVVMPDYLPALKFKGQGMYMSLNGNQVIPVEVINVDKIKVSIHRVYDNNIVYLLNNMGSYYIPRDLGMDVYKKELITGAQRNKRKDVPIDLKEILSGSSQGLFFLEAADSNNSYWNADTRLILATDIGIAARRSESGLLVWLNSISTASPFADTTVKVFTKTNQQILQGTTNEDGMVLFKDVDFAGSRKPFIITAAKADDLSFIELEKCAISETAFDIQGRPYLSSGYEAFLYTDRGMYRPGESVHLRAIVRGRTLEAPESFPVVVEVKRPDGRRFATLNSILSGFGTADIDIDIPDYALTGAYAAELTLPGDKKVMGTCKFNVEEFMPDRLKVSIDVADKRFNMAEPIPIKVSAEQFFGAPAAGRDVELTCRLRQLDFKVKGYGDYTFADKTKPFAAKTLRLGEKRSDKEGKASFELKLPTGIMPPSALSCSISAVVKELGGRAVTSRIDRYIDAYPYYIGIRRAAKGYAAINEPLKLDYVIVSSAGKVIAKPIPLEVKVFKLAWNNVLKKDKRGRYRYVSKRREELIFEDTIASKGSSGVYTYIPKGYGSYVIRIASEEKDSHSASLEFYCSGYGYIPWSMEQPDRIELSLDKPRYLPGERARLLIKSPFAGRALITISKENVLFSKVLELTSATQEIPMAIDEEFAPNAYCSVTVIRPIRPEGKRFAHRAYGVVPIMLDNTQHSLKVKVESQKQASPGDTIKLNIDVRPSKGLAARAELSVALVDEGVLRLSGFDTPDPFGFFCGKRANSIKAYDLYSRILPEFDKTKVGKDSTPSGGKSAKAFDPKKHLNPISARRVKPVVLWKSNIVTDERGKADVEFKIPDFNGTLRIMAIATGNKEFGSAQEDIKIAEPLMIKPTIPRFLSVEDEFTLPVSVFNNTGREGSASVLIEPQEGLDVIGERHAEINIRGNQEAAVAFRLKASPIPEKAALKIKASMGKYTTSRATELPIRPPAPFTTISGSGSLEAPAKAPINIPAGWLKGTENYTLAITSLPALKFAGGLKFLSQYPYGCIEQTTSRAFPLLYLKDMAALIDPKKFSAEGADSYIDSAIRRILSMQTYSGGFAMWPGYQRPYNWGSVYATDFLIEADNAGYHIPRLEKDAALGYLEKMLYGKDKKYSLNLKAYSCFVLAKAGRVKASWIRRLQERKDELSVYSRFHLAAALYALGDEKAVSDILGRDFPDTRVKRETGSSLNSYTRENAIALSVYMDIDPENDMVPLLIKRLELSMKDGSWPTTQDNAMALLALGKYTRYLKEQDRDYTGTVSIGKDLLAEFNSEEGARIENIALGGEKVTLSLEGDGRAYYYWSAEGVPVKEKIKEEDKGIKARRGFFTRDGLALDINNIRRGDILVVDISLDADSAYKNVIVADLLPACFEIENPRISTRQAIGWISKDAFEPGHIDIRDDRLLLFTDLPRAGKLHYRYVVRAVTEGEFALPPISASCMYDPSVSSAHGAGTIKVKEYVSE